MKQFVFVHDVHLDVKTQVLFSTDLGWAACVKQPIPLALLLRSVAPYILLAECPRHRVASLRECHTTAVWPSRSNV